MANKGNPYLEASNLIKRNQRDYEAEGYQSAEAKARQAREALAESQRRIQALDEYTNRKDYDYGSKEFSKGAVKSTAQQLYRFITDGAENAAWGIISNDENNVIDFSKLSREQRNVVNLLDAEVKRKKTIKQLEQQRDKARIVGLDDEVAQYGNQIAEQESLRSAYQLTPEQLELVNSPSNQEAINKIMQSKESGNYDKLSPSVQKIVDKRLKRLQDNTLGYQFSRNLNRIEGIQKAKDERKVFASDVSFDANYDYETTIKGESPFLATLKSYGKTPNRLLGDSSQLAMYAHPYSAAYQTGTDLFGFNNQVEQNILQDTDKSYLTVEERNRKNAANALNIPLTLAGSMGLNRFLSGNTVLGGTVSKVLNAPKTKAADVMSGFANIAPKTAKAARVAGKTTGAVAGSAGRIGTGFAFEAAQEGLQQTLEQAGSNRELNYDQIMQASAAGGIIGGMASTTGEVVSGATKGAKALKSQGDKAYDKYKNRDLNDDKLLDSNNKKFNPYAVVADANKVLAQRNPAPEDIEIAEKRIQRAEKAANDKVTSLGTKLEDLRAKQDEYIDNEDIDAAEKNFKEMEKVRKELNRAEEAKIKVDSILEKSIKATKSKKALNQAKEINDLTTKARELEDTINTAETAEVADKATEELEKVKEELDTYDTEQVADDLLASKDKSLEDIGSAINNGLNSAKSDPQLATSQLPRLEELSRKLDKLKAVENGNKGIDEVESNIFKGAKGYKGTPTYVSDSVKASDRGNQQAYDKNLGSITTFRDGHANKLEALKQAEANYEATGTKQVVYKERVGGTEWKVASQNSVKMSRADRARLGAVFVEGTSKGITNNVAKEVNHLNEVIDFMQEYDAAVKSGAITPKSAIEEWKDATTANNDNSDSSDNNNNNNESSVNTDDINGSLADAAAEDIEDSETGDASNQDTDNNNNSNNNSNNNNNSKSEFEYDRTKWTDGNDKGETLSDKVLKEIEERDQINLKEGDLENTENINPTGEIITNDKKKQISLGGQKYLYNKDGITTLDGNPAPKEVQEAYDRVKKHDESFYDTELGKELYGNTRGVTFDVTTDEGDVIPYRATYNKRKNHKGEYKWYLVAEMQIDGKWYRFINNNTYSGDANYEFILTDSLTVVDGDTSNIKHFVGNSNHRVGKRIIGEYENITGNNAYNDSSTSEVKSKPSKDKKMVFEIKERDDGTKYYGQVPEASALINSTKGINGKEKHFYNDAANLSNKSITFDGDTSIWSTLVSNTFEGANNSGEYSKDDTVLVVLPQGVDIRDEKGNVKTDELRKAANAGATIIVAETSTFVKHKSKPNLIDNAQTIWRVIDERGFYKKETEEVLAKDRTGDKYVYAKYVANKVSKPSTNEVKDPETKEEFIEAWKEYKKINPEAWNEEVNNYLNNRAFKRKVDNKPAKFEAFKELLKEEKQVADIFIKEADKLGINIDIDINAGNVAATRKLGNGSYKVIVNPSLFKGMDKYITSSKQKTIMFNSMEADYGFGKKEFLEFLNTDDKIITFLLAHEKSHIDNKDSEVYFAVNRDMTSPDKIAIETRATLDGLEYMGKKLTKVKTNKQHKVRDYDNELTQKSDLLLAEDVDVINDIVAALDTDTIADKAGLTKEEITDSHIKQLKAFKEFNDKFTKDINKLVAVNSKINTNNPLFKYLVVKDDKGNNVLPSNVVTAIALSAFKYLQTEGNTLKLTDSEVRSVHNIDAYTNIFPETSYKLARLGSHKGFINQELGKVAASSLGLQYLDNARVNAKGELESSLGALMYELFSTNMPGVFGEPTELTNKQRVLMVVAGMPIGAAKEYANNQLINPPNLDKVNSREQLVKALNDIPNGSADGVTTSFFVRIDNGFDAKSQSVYAPDEVVDVLAASEKSIGEVDILDKLFGKSHRRKEPYSKPPKFTQKTAKGSRAKLSNESIAAFEEISTYKWGIEKDKADFMIDLFNSDEEAVFRLLGLPTDEEINAKHPEIRDMLMIETMTAKQLVREQIAWLNSTRDSEGNYAPFYMKPVVWQNSRFGYDSTLFNAQTDIFARMLTNLEAWETTVSNDPNAALVNEDGTTTKEGRFYLALAERAEGVSKVFGDAFAELGYDSKAKTPDKVKPEDYLHEFVNYLNTDKTFNDAYNAMSDLLKGEAMSSKKLEAINAFKDVAGTGPLALGMLIEYAKFKEAGGTYTTKISLQSDGITNGPVITDILFGVFSEESLIKGGIIPSSMTETFNDFFDTKKAGYTDKYQDTGSAMGNLMASYMPSTEEIVELLSGIDREFGSRSWAKKLVTPFNYGSGIAAMKRAISAGFVNKVVADYHAAYEMDADSANEIYANIHNLLANSYGIYNRLKEKVNSVDDAVLRDMVYLHNHFNPKLKKQYVNNVINESGIRNSEIIPEWAVKRAKGDFNKSVILYTNSLKNKIPNVRGGKQLTPDNIADNFHTEHREVIAFIADVSYGTASTMAISQQEKESIEIRRQLTDATVRAVKLEKFLEDAYINMIVTQKDDYVSDKRTLMTIGQKKQLDAFLDKYRANTHSGMSNKHSADRESGLVVAKENKDVSFGHRIIFGNIEQNDISDFTSKGTNAVTYNFTYKSIGDPGVSASAMIVQSLDADIATDTVSSFKAMNLHDSASFSLDDFIEGVRKQNQEFYDSVISYNIFLEVLEAYARPVRGMRELLKDDATPEYIKNAIRREIYLEVEGNRTRFDNPVGSIELIYHAQRLSDTKIDKLPLIGTVHQYGGYDGQVSIEEKPEVEKLKEEANKAISEVVSDIFGKETNNNTDNVTDNVEEVAIPTNLSLLGLMDVLFNPNNTPVELYNIIDSLKDSSLTKTKIDYKGKGTSVRFSKLHNKIIVGKGFLNQSDNNLITTQLKRVAMEAALHNNLKAIKNGTIQNKELSNQYNALKVLTNSLDSLIARAQREGNLTDVNVAVAKQLLADSKRGNVEHLMTLVLTDAGVRDLLNNVPNYTGIDSNDVKSSNIFKLIKDFVINVLSLGKAITPTEGDTLFNLVSSLTDSITTGVTDIRKKGFTIDSMISNSKVISLAEASDIAYDHEYNNHILNGYDSEYQLILTNLASAEGSDGKIKVSDALIVAKNLLRQSDTASDGYNQALLPVIDMLLTYSKDNVDMYIANDETDFSELGLPEQQIARLEQGRSVFMPRNGNNKPMIVLSTAMVSSTADTRMSTVIHELLHAFTFDTINSPKNGAIRKKLRELRSSIRSTVTQEQLADADIAYALDESLPIDEFVVQVMTLPKVRELLRGVEDGKLLQRTNPKENAGMFDLLANMFGYTGKDSKTADALHNFSRVFGRIVINNKNDRGAIDSRDRDDAAIERLDAEVAKKILTTSQQLQDMGFVEDSLQIAREINRERKTIDKPLESNVLGFIRQKAKEQNNYELLNAVDKHEQQVQSQLVVSFNSPDVRFTPSEMRDVIKKSDNSESDNSNYLDVVDNNILKPLESLISDELSRGYNPETIWHNAILQNNDLTVSEAFNVGFELNNEQGYMLEALESVLAKTIDKVNNTAAYRQLESVYDTAKDMIKAEDFHNGDWYLATQEEKQIAREKLTYLFRPQDSDAEGKSNYLIRFAALSMVSPEIQKVLNFSANRGTVGDSWFEKATSVFSNALEVIDGNISAVSTTAPLDKRITDLSIQLANNYAKEHDRLADIENSVVGKISDIQERFSDTVLDAAKEAGIAITSSDIVSKYPAGRLTNKALKGELNNFYEYSNFFMDYINKNTPLGTARETLNETISNTAKDQEIATDGFHIAKAIEKKRGHVIDAVRRNILDSFSPANRELDNENKKAVSDLLRVDIQSLLDSGFSYTDIIDLLSDPDTRNSKIAELYAKLDPTHQKEFASRADNLAYYMVKGTPKKPMLAKNARAILARVGFGNINNNFNKADIKNLDVLTTLYAINYLDSGTIDKVLEIHNKEEGDKNGLEATIKAHRKATKDSAKLFLDNPYSMQKGYLPSVYASNKGFVIVDRREVATYEELGYVENAVLDSALQEDELFIKGEMVLMTISENGKQRYVSGAFSIENPSSKGSSAVYDYDKHRKVVDRQRREYNNKTETNMVPVYDVDGKVTGFRYEMSSKAKDSYLGRRNDFSTLISQFEGSNISKELYPDANKRLVDRLIEDSDNVKGKDINGYIEITPDSDNKRIQEFWAMLPKETRMYIKQQTGANSLLIRKRELNLLMGYRKFNPSDSLVKEYSDMNIAEVVFSGVMEGLFGKKAKLRFDQGYRPLLETIKALKDFIIVRNVDVLNANIKSNIALLMLNQATPVQSLRDIKDALVYSIKYQKDASELLQLEHDIALGYTSVKNISRLTELKDRIAKNPLKAFIDAGMMPMIVNDVSFKKGEIEEDTFVDKVKDKTVNKLPKPLRTTVDVALVNEGTKLHSLLSNATQQSDFVFKYALYKQEVRKGKSEKEALDRAREVFIDYDIPTNKYVQFVNDAGLWMFTKFALRIQRVILRHLRENPMRLGTEALVSEQLGNPSIISLNLFSSLNGGGGLRNPMSSVLTMYEHALPIQLLQSVIK